MVTVTSVYNFELPRVNIVSRRIEKIYMDYVSLKLYLKRFEAVFR